MRIDCCKSYVGKQIVGLLPGDGGTPVCYYRVSVVDFAVTCFTSTGWDFNGQGVDFNAVANSFGGYYVQDGNPVVNLYDTCDQVTFYYIGYAAPSNLTVYDPSAGLLDLPFYNAGCYFGCVTWEPIKLDQVYDSILFNGSLNTTTAAYGGTLDFVNDLLGSESILNAIFNKYYPGSSVNVTESLGFITITFNNVWYDPAYLTSVSNTLTYNSYTSVQNLTASEC